MVSIFKLIFIIKIYLGRGQFKFREISSSVEIEEGKPNFSINRSRNFRHNCGLSVDESSQKNKDMGVENSSVADLSLNAT